MQSNEGDQRDAIELAVQRRERLAALIVASASEPAVIAIDLEAHVIAWNSGAERLLGWT